MDRLTELEALDLAACSVSRLDELNVELVAYARRACTQDVRDRAFRLVDRIAVVLSARLEVRS